MQISGIGANGVMNTPSDLQTKDVDKSEFAAHLATATEKAQMEKDDTKLKKTCQDMEAMFLNMLMADMRKTVQKSKLVDSSKEEIMTSMLDSEMTKDMAKAGGMGLADMLYRQLRITAKNDKNPQALK
jgi:flagellar protein FlgJ